MKECFGHKPSGIPAKKKVKYNYPYKRNKPKPDYLSFIKSKQTLTALELARHFLFSTIAAGKVLRDYEKQGIVESMPRQGNEIKIWRVI